MNEVFVVAVPVAVISWTITQEEICREIRDYCKSNLHPKIAYLSGCYYCLSHWVAFAFTILFGTDLVRPYLGYIVYWLSLVAISNVYLTLYQMGRACLRGIKAWADMQEDQRALFNIRKEILLKRYAEEKSWRLS